MFYFSYFFIKRSQIALEILLNGKEKMKMDLQIKFCQKQIEKQAKFSHKIQ